MSKSRSASNHFFCSHTAVGDEVMHGNNNAAAAIFPVATSPSDADEASLKRTYSNHSLPDSNHENVKNPQDKVFDLSPLKSKYAETYRDSVSRLARNINVDIADLSTRNRAAEKIINSAELVSMVVNTNAHPLANQYAHEFSEIRQFIENFLNTADNFDVTLKAYHRKMDYFIDQEKAVISNIEAEMVELRRELLAQADEKYGAWLYAQLEHAETVKREAQGKIIAIQKKRAAGCEPLCLSFVLVHDQSANRNIIILGMSSPEKNPDMFERFQTFASMTTLASVSVSSVPTSSSASAVMLGRVTPIIIADPASIDYQKFMQQIAKVVSAPHPADPLKECAEKSYFSLLTKLYETRGCELAIKMICNFAFFPQLKKAQGKPKSKEIELIIKGDPYALSLIPPCQDCKKNMEVNAVLINGAAKGEINTSPLKQKTAASILASRTWARPISASVQRAADSAAMQLRFSNEIELTVSPTKRKRAV